MMATMASLLSEHDLDRELLTVPSWKYDFKAKTIARLVKRPTFMDGIDFVRDVAELAEDMNHHPDIDIRWTALNFTLSTHSAGGLTALDFELARQIDALLA